MECNYTMKLYFATGMGQTEYFKKIKVKNHLISFFYTKNLKKYYELCGYKPDIFLDSGGYSVRVSNKKINLNTYLMEYIKFIKENNIKTYANLDMDTYEETIMNQKIMEDSGLNPIPVYHFSEFKDKKYREVMIQYCKKYPYVAIGGVAGTVKNSRHLHLYLSYCFKIAKKYNTKIHGFGITDPKLLSKYNFYSIDSTSWHSGSRYGLIYHFNNNKIKLTNLKTKFTNKQLDLWNLVQWNKYADYLEEKK